MSRWLKGISAANLKGRFCSLILAIALSGCGYGDHSVSDTPQKKEQTASENNDRDSSKGGSGGY